jgi:hypothetical protein
MFKESDNFICSFKPCPPELVDVFAKAQKVVSDSLAERKIRPKSVLNVEQLNAATVTLFGTGLQFYGAQSFMCSDLIPLYGLTGDAFKTAGDGFALSRETWLLAMYSYARAGCCYWAANERFRSAYAFFRALKLSLSLHRKDLAKHFCSQGWQVIVYEWLLELSPPEERLTPDNIFLELSGYEFQWLVWHILREDKFEVEVAKPTHDGGIDLFGTIDDGYATQRILIQCKNPRKRGRNVGASAIRDLLGVYALHKPDRLMFFSSTDFTDSAVKTAKTLPVRLDLVNRSCILKKLKSVRRSDLFIDDIPVRDDEERKEVIEFAKRGGIPLDFISAASKRQGLLTGIIGIGLDLRRPGLVADPLECTGGNQAEHQEIVSAKALRGFPIRSVFV